MPTGTSDWNIRMLDLINRERLLNELLEILEARKTRAGLSDAQIAMIDEKIAAAELKRARIGARIENHNRKERATFRTNKTMEHVEELAAAIAALRKLNVRQTAVVGMVRSVMDVLAEV